jgi:hypothetical protein
MNVCAVVPARFGMDPIAHERSLSDAGQVDRGPCSSCSIRDVLIVNASVTCVAAAATVVGRLGSASIVPGR